MTSCERGPAPNQYFTGCHSQIFYLFNVYVYVVMRNANNVCGKYSLFKVCNLVDVTTSAEITTKDLLSEGCYQKRINYNIHP